MKTIIFSAALVAIVSAGSGSGSSTEGATSSSSCAAQNILESCLKTCTGYLDLCASQDYGCLCEKYTSIMTCFDNCPNDSRKPSYAGSQQVYCMNASVYSSSTKTPTASASASTAATSGENGGTNSGKGSSGYSGGASKTSEQPLKSTGTPAAVTPAAVGPSKTSGTPKGTAPAAVSVAAAPDVVRHGPGALAAFAGIAAALF
ncbi:hypothetical protein F5Y16DRAFT_242715 [Xylariaceae sp. FL0255]|nr:hypothetical protein F5Y16DRAFT_242715 [Xylariaceae sp. FL0255]